MNNTLPFDWDKIWENQTKKYNNLRDINGWGHSDMNPSLTVDSITNRLNLSLDDTMLEVGCGCGLLSELFIKNVKEYVGMDKQQNLIDLAKKSFDFNFICSEASNLPFNDNEFDYLISYSIFQYFPSDEYVKTTISEMKRVARKGIYIGDLPMESHEKHHHLYKKEDFNDEWNVNTGLYTNKRFDVYQKFNDNE